jgi:hypothetical protein
LGAFFLAGSARQKKPGFPLQVLGFANANPVGFPLQSLARAPAAAHEFALQIRGRIIAVQQLCAITGGAILPCPGKRTRKRVFGNKASWARGPKKLPGV